MQPAADEPMECAPTSNCFTARLCILLAVSGLWPALACTPQQEDREVHASKEPCNDLIGKLCGWQCTGSGPWSTQQQKTRLECQLRVCLLRDVEEEEAADLGAFQREYEDDHSWEALQEDEFGRLRPLVRIELANKARVSARDAHASVAVLLLQSTAHLSSSPHVQQQSTPTVALGWLLDRACSTRRGHNAPRDHSCRAQRQPTRHGAHPPAPWAAGTAACAQQGNTALLAETCLFCLLQDQKEEQRAKRRRLLSAAASARIRRGMIRYLQVGRLAVHTWALWSSLGPPLAFFLAQPLVEPICA